MTDPGRTAAHAGLMAPHQQRKRGLIAPPCTRRELPIVLLGAHLFPGQKAQNPHPKSNLRTVYGDAPPRVESVAR